MRFPVCLVLAGLAALLTPVLGMGQSVCIEDQTPEFVVWEEGPNVCEGTRFVLANSIEVNGAVTEVTLTFAAPLNLQGSQLLIANPDGSERHLLSDVDEDPCGLNATSFTPVNWGDILQSSTFTATYQLSIPLVGDGIWDCGFRLAADDCAVRRPLWRLQRGRRLHQPQRLQFRRNRATGRWLMHSALQQRRMLHNQRSVDWVSRGQ